jgi:hypothetical protein
MFILAMTSLATTSIIPNSLVFVTITFIANRVNDVANIFLGHPAGEKKKSPRYILAMARWLLLTSNSFVALAMTVKCHPRYIYIYIYIVISDDILVVVDN